MITDYSSFLKALSEAGFSMGGGNSEGIYAVVPWNWNEAPPYETPVRWHTGDPDTDPWEWRMRVLDERDDIAYAKVFFRKSGYIMRDWYPLFLRLRRHGKDFQQTYSEGTISREAKTIYDLIAQYDALPVHVIKSMAGFGKESASQFERALTDLQMRMFITMCGRQQKTSLKGEEYGWSSTVFCTVGTYFGEGIEEEAMRITEASAREQIRERILLLSPDAPEKRIAKFLGE